MPNLHTSNEALKTLHFKKNMLTILLFSTKWMRYVTLAQIYD